MENNNNIANKEIENSCGVFTLREVLAEFNAKFLDDRQCREWIIGKMYQGTKRCPECREEILKSQLQSFWDGKRIKCWNCGKYFTALTGTFLSGCHFDFREIILLAFMLALGVEDKQIAERLKITAESVRLWRLKSRELEKVKQ